MKGKKQHKDKMTDNQSLEEDVEMLVASDIEKQKLTEIVQKAKTACSQGKWQKAVGFFNEAIRTGGDNKEFYRKMSYCYLNLGDFVSSIEMDKKAIKVDPDYLEGYVGLIVGYACINDLTNTLNTFYEWKNKNPNWQNHREVLYYVGRILFGHSRRKEAKKYLQMMNIESWNTTHRYDTGLKSGAEQLLRCLKDD